MNQLLSPKASLAGKTTKVVLFYVALVLAALLWFTPVITLVLNALKDAGDFAINGAFPLPKFIRWANFSEAWETGVKKYFWNSVIVTGIKVPIGIVLESMAAFALTPIQFKWADRIFTYILIGLIVPMQMTLVPLTLLMNALNLIDTLTGLTILYILGLVQFSTQFSTQYDQLAAAVLIAVVPIVVVFLFFQRYFVAGIGGAVK